MTASRLIAIAERRVSRAVKKRDRGTSCLFVSEPADWPGDILILRETGVILVNVRRLGDS